MVKIGDVYFNEAQIAAIKPGISGVVATVYLTNGAEVTTTVRAEGLPLQLEREELLTGLQKMVGNV